MAVVDRHIPFPCLVTRSVPHQLGSRHEKGESSSCCCCCLRLSPAPMNPRWSGTGNLLLLGTVRTVAAVGGRKKGDEGTCFRTGRRKVENSYLIWGLKRKFLTAAPMAWLSTLVRGERLGAGVQPLLQCQSLPFAKSWLHFCI